MISSDLSKAKLSLSALSQHVVLNFGRIKEFLRLAEAGAKAIRTGLYQLPEFKIPDELPHDLRRTLVVAIPKLRVGGMFASADAAALVFAHAILDDLATECCKVSAMADPLAWESEVNEKEVSLSELKCDCHTDVTLRPYMKRRIERANALLRRNQSVSCLDRAGSGLREPEPSDLALLARDRRDTRPVSRCSGLDPEIAPRRYRRKDLI
jgi:hypothetical protein